MSRLRRFLHLERPREAEAAEVEARATAARFEGFEPPRAPREGGAGSSGATLERFGREPDPALELDDWRKAANPDERREEARLEAELDRARRAMGEELAREVGARERRRLDAELGPSRWAERLLAAVLRGPRRRR